MYCSKCGSELPADSSFCNKCGAAVSGEVTSAPTAGSAEILEELKKYKKHTYKDILCLECGYKGIMGVSDQNVVKCARLKGAVAFVIGFVIILVWVHISFTDFNPLTGAVWLNATGRWILGIGAGVLLAVISAYYTRKKLACPSCKTLIWQK